MKSKPRSKSKVTAKVTAKQTTLKTKEIKPVQIQAKSTGRLSANHNEVLLVG